MCFRRVWCVGSALYASHFVLLPGPVCFVCMFLCSVCGGVICPGGRGWTSLSGGRHLTGLLLLCVGDGHLLEVLDQIGHIIVTGIGG